MPIYAIQDMDSGFIKLGFSSDPMRRYRALQTDNSGSLRVLAVFPGDLAGEKTALAKFQTYVHRGEWFMSAEAIWSWLAAQVTLRPDRPFSSWLARHIKRDSVIGDLARDAKRDATWPADSVEFSDYHQQLRKMNACSAAYSALNEAWSFWLLSPWTVLRP